MIINPKDIEKIIRKHSQETTKDIDGVSCACVWMTSFDEHSQLGQIISEIYQEFQATSELAKLKERVLELERKEFRRSGNETTK